MNFFFPRPCLRATAAGISVLTLAICYLTPRPASAAGGFNTLSAATASTDCDVRFDPSVNFDSGREPSVAMHASGLVLEYHRTHAYGYADLWYRIGKVNGTGVTWGQAQKDGRTGHYPTIALSKEGYVLVVHGTRDQISQNASHLYYRVGWIDPNGDQNQTISWKTNDIHWDSAPWGIRYETGVNPGIAINNHNQVVEVHQVPDETPLHYHRGIVKEGVIEFAASVRYDNHAEDPAVALLDSGLVLEVHSLGGLISRTGKLSLSNSTDIEWSTPITVDDKDRVSQPTVATNGRYAIEACTDWSEFYRICYSVAKICDSFR